MIPVRRVVAWLRAPLPNRFRARGTPARFRKRAQMTHLETRVYEGSAGTADQLFDGSRRTWTPYLVFHDWRLDWNGREYNVIQKDWPRKFAFRDGQHFPCWVDPGDLSSVWIIDGEHPCQPRPPEEVEDETEGPLLAVDVHYSDDGGAVAAGILFGDWQDPAPAAEVTARIDRVAPYEPGQFYKRELPCILALLDKLEEQPSAIVIDGFVTLGAEARAGLGLHLYRALGGKIPVVGVAKNPFAATPAAAELRRGASGTPLYVTAAGMSQMDAKACIAAMHGPHRLPVLLKAADRLCRDGGPEEG